MEGGGRRKNTFLAALLWKWSKLRLRLHNSTSVWIVTNEMVRAVSSSLRFMSLGYVTGIPSGSRSDSPINRDPPLYRVLYRPFQKLASLFFFSTGVSGSSSSQGQVFLVYACFFFFSIEIRRSSKFYSQLNRTWRPAWRRTCV